jgi:hypothetical protein
MPQPGSSWPQDLLEKMPQLSVVSTGTTLGTALSATCGSTMCRVREVECTYSDDNVYHDAQYTFEVVRLAVA